MRVVADIRRRRRAGDAAAERPCTPPEPSRTARLFPRTCCSLRRPSGGDAVPALPPTPQAAVSSLQGHDHGAYTPPKSLSGARDCRAAVYTFWPSFAPLICYSRCLRFCFRATTTTLPCRAPAPPVQLCPPARPSRANPWKTVSFLSALCHMPCAGCCFLRQLPNDPARSLSASTTVNKASVRMV